MTNFTNTAIHKIHIFLCKKPVKQPIAIDLRFKACNLYYIH